MSHPSPSSSLARPARRPLRLGILGCAKIARQFARDVAGSPWARIDAVASRSLATAEAFARDLGVQRHHASYEALLADAAVDAIYLPLPNSLHAEWAMRAAAAGKHILCEKPLALNLAEARAMFAAAERHGVVLLEAYPYYFQPQTRNLLACLHGGAIGEVRSVQASFGFTLPPAPDNIRLQPELGGGALLDAGSYPLSLIRLVMGEAPVRVLADATWTPGGVDLSTTGTLYYADGRRAQLSCAMDAANHRRATIVGTAGTLETEYLNHTAMAVGDNPWGYLPSQLRLRRGTANSRPFEEIASATGSGFRFAAEAFARVVAAGDRGAIARAAQASLDIAATLEALARSARTGRIEAVEPTMS
ncbi:MAG: Gfo/Idh/MocA family oxidoreductase [Rhodoferax sp.]|nr:Gfo/Idh/MocA family oxidoreductase [Rhodoferax sp.]